MSVHVYMLSMHVCACITIYTKLCGKRFCQGHQVVLKITENRSRGLDTLSTVKRGLVDPGAHQPELSQEPENTGIVGIVLQVRNHCEGVRVMLKELV